MSYAEEPGYAPSGPRIPVRLIAGVLIALVALIGYFTSTQVNPVTGQKQHVAMGPEQEMTLGLQAAPQMAREMGGSADPATDPRARLVEQVGRKIVAESEAQKSPYVGNFHFYLLNDRQTVNAFALPGGQVFITRALFDMLGDEAQLAGVLGHEIGHVIGRHGAEHMAKGRLGQLLTVAVGVGASDRDDGGRTAQMAAAMANQMLQLKYGRDDESQADGFGLRFMKEAGYDPSAMLDVMRVLKAAAKGPRQPEMLSTHPLPETRFDAVKATLAQTYPDGIPRNLTRGRPLPGARRGDDTAQVP